MLGRDETKRDEMAGGSEGYLRIAKYKLIRAALATEEKEPETACCAMDSRGMYAVSKQTKT